MTKSVKTILIVIGALSIISGIYLAIDGSDFTTYFSGMFLGIVLIGSATFFNDESKSNNKK